MDQNASSPREPETGPAVAPLPAGVEGPGAGVPPGLEGLAGEVAGLLVDDLKQLGDALLAAQVVALERLSDQLAAVRLRRLAAVDARGAPGAERGVQALSTQGWLRATCRTSAAAAGRLVRTARALHRGPLRAAAAALAAGEVSYQHAAVLADATHGLPPAKVAEGEPVLLDAARRLDPACLRRLATHARDLVDPDRAEERTRKRLDRRGLWVDATFEGMVDVRGLLDPEAGEAVQAALGPLARPTGPDDERSGPQRRADALAELARRALQAGDLPQQGGLRPNVNVTIELASLRSQPGLGGTGGWGGVLPPETVRRLACDAVITRAVVRRHPDLAGAGHGEDEGGLAAALREAVSLLPPPLGAPVALLDLGRAARVVSPALRRALAVRDGGCVAVGCGRPVQWCDAHHLVHWADGGPTSLVNVVPLCRVHHVAAHEGGWELRRDPATGRVNLVPPARHHYGHPPPAA